MQNTAPDPAPVHVAVGVILDSDNNILIARRAPEAHQGGLWEFPGGKVEPGETVIEALARELREELDIVIGRTSALMEIRHSYKDKVVLLDVHLVWDFSNKARAAENQPLQWVAAQELSHFQFPAANVPIIEAVQKRLSSGT